MKEYTLGIYEKALPVELSWEERFSAAREAGFDFLEMSLDETDGRLARLDWDATARHSLLYKSLDCGLPIRSMCLSAHRKYPLGSHDPVLRQRSLDIMEKSLDLACDLGIRIIQLAGYDVYYETGDQSSREFFTANLSRCVEMAATYGVILGFETMETPFMDTVGKVMEYVKAVNSPYLGLYPDLGNLTNAAHLYGTSLQADIQKGTGHMFAMHLKETRRGMYRNLRFGEGWVDFASGAACAWDQGTRRFVAEFWDDGREDWRVALVEADTFLRRAVDSARESLGDSQILSC